MVRAYPAGIIDGRYSIHQYSAQASEQAAMVSSAIRRTSMTSLAWDVGCDGRGQATIRANTPARGTSTAGITQVISASYRVCQIRTSRRRCSTRGWPVPRRLLRVIQHTLHCASRSAGGGPRQLHAEGALPDRGHPEGHRGQGRSDELRRVARHSHRCGETAAPTILRQPMSPGGAGSRNQRSIRATAESTGQAVRCGGSDARPSLADRGCR
jgi:hypothetical protein